MSKEHERFREMVESSQDWFWEFDEKANFTYVSPTVRALLGYEPEELIGLNAFDLMEDEEAARVREHFDPIAEKYLPFNHLVNVNLHKDGHEVIVESSGTPIFDETGRFRGYRGIDRDITARKRAEDALRKSQELLNETKRIAKIGSWQFDLVNNCLNWSDETYRLFGMDPDTSILTYETFLNAVHPEDRSAVDAAYTSSLREGRSSYEIEHRIILKNTGEIRYVHEKCRHERDPKGAIVRSIGMVQDITDRKANEVALQVATQAAVAASRAKSLFLAKASHEIRTPLTAIIGYGELLEDAELTAQHRKYLEAINTASNTLSLLVDDILDLSKIEAGELVVKREEINLRNFIAKLASLQEQQMVKKNLSFSVNIDRDVPDLLVGDPLRIQQLLLNLLGNAIKFTEKGAIGITVSMPEEVGAMVLLDIAIKDTGIGIPRDLQGRIFDPFVQGLGSDTHDYGGFGLGLAISQSLAELMGGTLRMESEEGVGSTFHLLLPLQRKNDATSVEPVAEKGPRLWHGPALTVLLAEDNRINAQFLRTVLTNMGHDVTVAENGFATLEALPRNNFDLLLMDIKMPVMNGVDVLKVLREQEQHSGKHLKVIALTAYALIGNKEEYLKMGFDGYLRKPVRTMELQAEMERVVLT